MARLLPHLTQELENELVNAVRESNDGYPHHLRDMQGHYDSITEADIDAVSEALWVLYLNETPKGEGWEMIHEFAPEPEPDDKR